jgi:enoyl-CoA hydratase/carnithine racemase
MTTEDVLITRTDALTHIRLNRPHKRNALTVAMYAAMADALTGAETDGTAVVLISGAGTGFSAGNDLIDFMHNRTDEPNPPVQRFLHAIARSTRILIATVQGNAVGVGTTLLLHCDFVLAEPDAVLTMPFTDLGLVPEAGSSLLLPRAIGHQRAAALMLLGEPLPAARAEAIGLVNRVVAAGHGVAEAEALAVRLLAKPRTALLATKRLMKSPNTDLAGRMAEEGTAFAEGLRSPEFASIAAKFFAARTKAA